MAMPEKMIAIQGIKKPYGDAHAMRGADFYVEKGKMRTASAAPSAWCFRITRWTASYPWPSST